MIDRFANKALNDVSKLEKLPYEEFVAQKLHLKCSLMNLRLIPELRERNLRKLKKNELIDLKAKIHDTVLWMPKADRFTESQVRHFKWREMDFCWLAQHLLAPNERILGWPIKIPDMAFFKNGKVCLRIKTDNKGFLIKLNNPQKLKKTDIRSEFPTVVRDRRKRHIVGDDIEHILSEEQIIRTSGGSITAVPQEHREESFIDFNKGDAFKEFNLPPGKTLHGNYYRDLVVISFNPNAYHFKEVHQQITLENEDNTINNKNIRPFNEVEFLKIMAKRTNDEYWKTINFIQTWIKSKIGIGNHIVIDFYARINQKKHSRHIQYNFRRFKADEYLLSHNQQDYWLKQVVKMCFYISKLYGYEVIRLKAIFLQDDEGIIWLHSIEKWITRIKYNYSESKLSNGTSYWYWLDTEK